MKKGLQIVFALLLCLSLAGCSTDYAKEEYYNNSVIAARGDHCSKMLWKTTQTTFSATCSAKKFNGNSKIYECAITQEGPMIINCSLSVKSGVAKLVYVDWYDSVTTLVECTPDNPSVDSVDVEVNVNPGKCRIKLVGYDCEELDAKIVMNELK